ncbi:MAG: GNAT family N-acetyltransferase [Candidatus Micrarchaeia archaeon]
METEALNISVSKEYRNISISREMIKTLLDLAGREKYRIVSLEVYSNNHTALHLYEKLGFKTAGRIPKSQEYE